MKTKLLAACVVWLVWGGIAIAQSGPQLQLVGTIFFPADPNGCSSTDTTGGSDVWGYTAPDGSEYAIMGVMDGVAVVKVPEMQVIDVVPGPKNFDCYYHRDIKTYSHYAYVVNEMTGTNEGMMIIDLQYLPDSVHFVKSYVANNQKTSHNLSIDVATGYAYVLRSNGFGLRIISLADPENPFDVFAFDTGRIHDVYTRNDTMIVSEGNSRRFSIWDVSDKDFPNKLATFVPPSSGYAHNAWLSEDGRYVMTTEETTGKTVKMWDISDFNNISLVGEWLGASQLAHNTHIKGNYAYISHYKSGIHIVDISNPANPTEVARYDTYPQNDNSGFAGCWGAYPFTGSDYVYASDMNGKLTVLKFSLPTGIDEATNPLPATMDLSQNYPNPFNPMTQIKFQLSEAAAVELSVYDMQGRLVRTLIDEIYGPGVHNVVWNGRDSYGQPVASGQYIYRLKSEQQVLSRTMTLVK
jgi:choice-of-anchor B domain-containing protein